MAIYDIGMTMEEVQASGEMEAPPAGAEYRFRFDGLLKKDGSALFETQKGGKKVLAKLLVVSPDPTLANKGLIYTGVIGSFSFANLSKVIPGLMTSRGVDDEAGIGTEFTAMLTERTYTKADGSEGVGLNLSKMRQEG